MQACTCHTPPTWSSEDKELFKSMLYFKLYMCWCTMMSMTVVTRGGCRSPWNWSGRSLRALWHGPWELSLGLGQAVITEPSLQHTQPGFYMGSKDQNQISHGMQLISPAPIFVLFLRQGLCVPGWLWMRSATSASHMLRLQAFATMFGLTQLI